MIQWFTKTTDRYMKTIIWVCIGLLILIFFWNLLTNKKGSYVNHSEMIKELISKPLDLQNTYPIIDESKSFLSRGEKECKKAIEKLTQKPFAKTRPPFLKNEITGQNLELDCFNPELKLAVEYNGVQHYKYTPRFHSTKDAFYNIKYRDRIKEELCRKHGVKLIVVPYTVKLEDIERFIYDKMSSG